MPYKVDVDEADVAVLSQNLIKSKELFATIGQSLSKIADRSMRASSTIKPVLSEVNKLTKNKAEVEKGLGILKEVSETAEVINDYENILNNPIEVVGIAQYIKTLSQLKILFKEIKTKFKRFRGILINFETLIDKSDLKLQGYFQKLTNLDSEILLQNKSNQISELKFIFKHFKESKEGGDDEYVNKVFIKARSQGLLMFMKTLEPEVQPKNRKTNVPYEKGSFGIVKFNQVLIQRIDNEIKILNQIQVSPSMIESIVEETLSDLYAHKILGGISHYFNTPQSMTDNVVLLLEIGDNLLKFKSYLESIPIEAKEFTTAMNKYIDSSSVIFREIIKAIESRFNNFDKYTEIGVPEIIVDMISKIRKLSEFNHCLTVLISKYKLGEWLVINPPAKFISVYTSVIPSAGNYEESNAEFLLSSFYSDVIDSIMVNIEIGLKSYPEPPLKKSTQGFILVKNLIMVESIVSRSKELYSSMGSLGIERLNKLKNRFLKLFLDDWNYASYIIIRDMTTIATQNAAAHHHPQGGATSSVGTGGAVGNLSSKEREQVKELFKNFNESFEEAIRNYEKYNITDQNLRNYLSNEIKKLIMNAYYKLYDKYAHSDFTKNKSKYVKYDKHQFEKLLNDKL